MYRDNYGKTAYENPAVIAARLLQRGIIFHPLPQELLEAESTVDPEIDTNSSIYDIADYYGAWLW